MSIILNMTFSKVDFISAFAISFSDRTLHLRFLSGLVCGEQDLWRPTQITTEEFCPKSLLRKLKWNYFTENHAQILHHLKVVYEY